jgi:hypothetical protein
MAKERGPFCLTAWGLGDTAGDAQDDAADTCRELMEEYDAGVEIASMDVRVYAPDEHPDFPGKWVCIITVALNNAPKR